MKKLILKILTAIIIANSILASIPAKEVEAAVEGHLQVTSPNGGEVYNVGDTVTITWDASENIDKIMLGYSHGTGHLDWIATSIPNTGSYTWTVNVGNTTNTQYVIDITGYDTGVGSLTDRSDNWFTVNQKVIETEEETPVVKTPTKTTTTYVDITIINIEINTWYYFEGSQTTDLSSISDPSNVNNFTLDRQNLSMMTFVGAIDMSTDTAENAIKNLDSNVSFEYMYFWMEWEFWSIWQAPVEVTFYDNENKYTEDANVVLNGAVLEKDDYKITTAENGEKKVELSADVIKEHEGEKIEVKLEPTLTTNLESFQDNVDLETGILTITGNVSDKTAKVFVVLNGEEVEISYDENGDFSKDIQLIEGRNTIEAYAKNDEKEFGKVEGAIVYTAPIIVEKEFAEKAKEWVKKNWNYVVIGAASTVAVGTFSIIGIFSLVLKKNLFIAPFKIAKSILMKLLKK